MVVRERQRQVRGERRRLRTPDLFKNKSPYDLVFTGARVARRVKSLAKTSNRSANRIIVELIESGIEARQQERKRFLELADRLARSRDVEEQTRLKEELAVLTFGE